MKNFNRIEGTKGKTNLTGFKNLLALFCGKINNNPFLQEFPNLMSQNVISSWEDPAELMGKKEQQVLKTC
jgi:hypothetical protein